MIWYIAYRDRHTEYSIMIMVYSLQRQTHRVQYYDMVYSLQRQTHRVQYYDMVYSLQRQTHRVQYYDMVYSLQRQTHRVQYYDMVYSLQRQTHRVQYYDMVAKEVLPGYWQVVILVGSAHAMQIVLVLCKNTNMKFVVKSCIVS